MKKFTLPFDSYALLSDRPMAIELHPQGVLRYAALADNPLYYYNALQYTNGGFYRALLGYETIWDKESEGRLNLALDYYLTLLLTRGNYFFEEIKFNLTTTAKCVLWRKGIKPKHFNFYQMSRLKIKKGARALARVNLEDKPYHVDIDFEDGEIITISYLTYLQWKQKLVRRTKDAGHDTGKNGAHEKNGKRGETAKAEGVGRKITVKKMDAQLLSVRQRIRRAYSMSKACAKIY